MGHNNVVHLSDYSPAHRSHLFRMMDAELAASLIQLDAWRHTPFRMSLTIINHCSRHKKMGYSPNWEDIALAVLEAGCLSLTAVLIKHIADDVTKERIVMLTLEHKGVTLPSSAPPPPLHAPL